MKKLFSILTLTLIFIISMFCLTACETSSKCTHSGGKATCEVKAICNKCGKEYGELADHIYGEFISNGDGTHTKVCANDSNHMITENCVMNGNCCEKCDYKTSSEGLAYILINNGTEYEVSGIGSCTDTNIVIPSDFNDKPITGIRYSAFYNCTSLTSVVIPDSVTSIGEDAFYNCRALTSVNYIGTIDSWVQMEFNNFTSNPTHYAKKLYINNELVTETKITTATKINGYAFYNCDSLTSVVIGGSVTSIGEDAFYNCRALTSVNYTGTIDSWVQIGFNDYTSNPTYYAKKLYINNELVTEAKITTATKINGYAFQSCASISNIEIGESVTSIGDGAFSGCFRLVEVYNKSTLNIVAGSSDNGYVGYYALAVYTEPYTSKVSTDSNGYVIYTGGAEKIVVGYDGTATELVLPSDITKIGIGSFAYCDSLTSVEIGDSVTSIGGGAFQFCSSLTSVVIPDSVTSIDEGVFFGCSSLTSIEMPNRVTNIGNYAFRNCTSLTSIVLPDSVTEIGREAFQFCSSLTIYCEAESEPSGWSYSWNSSNRPVVWGYKGN